MTAFHAAGWMFMLACFAGIMLHWNRSRGTSGFCERCGNPRVMHKTNCPEAK